MELAREKAHEDVELWLDGGHNPHAGRAIAATMADLEERQPRPLIMIAGLQENKDVSGYFANFADLASAVFAVKSGMSAAADTKAVAAAAQAAGLPAETAASVKDALITALDTSLRSHEGPPRILICGSLYLAGEILADHH